MIKNKGKEKEKVMVVDDEKDTCDSVALVLESAGFSVEKAYSGKECLEKLESKWKFYDLVLIDIMMPGLSGIELLKILKKKIDNKITMAYLSIVPKAQVDLTNVDGFIQKPFDNDDLRKEVKEMIKKFKREREKKNEK